MNNKIVVVAILVILGIISVAFITSNKPNNKQQLSTTENPTIQDDWQPQTFSEEGLTLSFKIPPDTTFRKEIADDAGRVRVASFYVERGAKDNPTYQLYAVYQPLLDATEQDIEKVKTGMDPASIKETSIDGYSGIEGIANANDPKKHYATVVLKDGRLFSVSTYPPQPENKELTDIIVATFDFQ